MSLRFGVFLLSHHHGRICKVLTALHSGTRYRRQGMRIVPSYLETYSGVRTVWIRGINTSPYSNFRQLTCIVDAILKIEIRQIRSM